MLHSFFPEQDPKGRYRTRISKMIDKDDGGSTFNLAIIPESWIICGIGVGGGREKKVLEKRP